MTDNVKALVDALEAWASPISSGYEVPAAAQAILQAARTLTAQAEEIERLRKWTHGQWFYPPDNYDQEQCMWSPDEVIDYCDLEPGHHVIEVNVATPLPSIWCAVHVTSDEDADERFTFTEYATEEQARAALKAAQEVKA